MAFKTLDDLIAEGVESRHVLVRSDFATTITNATHTWLLDEPTSFPGAKDLGPNPFHMVLAGLAGCTHMTL